MKKPELLAPAGNLEKLKTAIDYGADAVYLGGSKLNLRAFADNFTNEQIKDILERYNSGNSIYAISKLYNVNHKVINRIIIENNLIKRDGRKKHFYNQTIF
mgnify:CR=1 FL=1